MISYSNIRNNNNKYIILYLQQSSFNKYCKDINNIKKLTKNGNTKIIKKKRQRKEEWKIGRNVEKKKNKTKNQFLFLQKIVIPTLGMNGRVK